MKIAVITIWYNEAFLAPFFFNHYAFADNIILLWDQASTDKAEEIFNCPYFGCPARFGQRKYVDIKPFSFPDGMDDELKIEKINYESSLLTDYDWLISVDADEFIFAPGFEYIREFLSRVNGNVVYADMWQVYRHRSDENLNPHKVTILQRRHGDPNNILGINGMYRKPCVVDPKVGIEWMPGCHSFKANNQAHVAPQRLLGAHWAMADPELAVKRRLQVKDRQSKNNLEKGLTVQNHFITKEEIITQCNQHLNDPQLF